MQAAIEDASEGNPLFLKLDLDCPILDETDSALLKLWHYIVKRARIFSCGMRFNNKPLFLAPGQFIFGRIQASFDLGLSEWTIRTRIKSLIDMGLLKKAFHKDGKRGYSVYQILLKNVNNPTPKKEKSPQTQNPLVKPKTASAPTTKKESIFSKKKQNNYAKPMPDSIHSPLRESDVCHSNSLLLQNDKHNGISRFGQDFLDWLLIKAKKFTDSPSNPIGLLIHMLRTGAYQGEYADIQKERERNLKFQQEIREQKEAEAKARAESERRNQVLTDWAFTKLQEEPAFKSGLCKLISIRLPLFKPFLKHQFGAKFTVEDVLSDRKSLSFFTEEINSLLKTLHEPGPSY